MSYFGNVVDRSSRASIAFISLAGTRTPSAYSPASRFTVGCRPFHLIRRARCRTIFQPLSNSPFHFFSSADGCSRASASDYAAFEVFFFAVVA
jgi:hypothetical protein